MMQLREIVKGRALLWGPPVGAWHCKGLNPDLSINNPKPEPLKLPLMCRQLEIDQVRKVKQHMTSDITNNLNRAGVKV